MMTLPELAGKSHTRAGMGRIAEVDRYINSIWMYRTPTMFLIGKWKRSYDVSGGRMEGSIYITAAEEINRGR